MCKDWLKKWICTDKIPKPTGLVDIDVSEIITILDAEFQGASIHFADSNYKTTTKTEMMRFLKNDIIDKNIYVSELYDCDDFSFALMGSISCQDWGALPFGILWTDVPGGAHAVNVFIDSNRKVWIIEPQNDKIFTCPDNWTPYFIVI